MCKNSRKTVKNEGFDLILERWKYGNEYVKGEGPLRGREEGRIR